MHRQTKTWLAVNFFGGVAVLGSYAHGLLTHPDTRGQLWGDVPDGLRPLYTVTMLCAAIGYFLFSYYFVVCLGPSRVQVGDRNRFSLMTALYALVLVASALWMPLSFAMLAAPSDALWIAIRVDLALVGLGSLGLLALLFALPDRPRGLAGWLALSGLVCFCLQTAFLDALVWPALVGMR